MNRLLALMPAQLRNRFLTKVFYKNGLELLDTAHNGQMDKFERGAFQELLQGFTATLNGLNNPSSRSSVLRTLLEMDNQLYRLISICAREMDDGLHPKHRLTGYHKFFCRNIGPQETVLDIGCGNGALTFDIAECTGGRVIGIDKSATDIEFAKANFRLEHLQFIHGDITGSIELPNCDVVVLSNVLEHLTERVQFLKRVREKVKPEKFLLRVPMYEREWMVPLKEELGLDFRLDRDHKIEYTQEQFLQEIEAVDLSPVHLEIRWGEIWSVARRRGA